MPNLQLITPVAKLAGHYVRCRNRRWVLNPTTEDRFFAASIDLLCFVDFNGHFKRVNPAWERTLGFTAEELTSRPFIEFVHPEDRERTVAQNALVRAGGNAIAFENRYRCKDGSYRWLLWNATSDASVSTIYSVARDVTAKKQADAEREQLVAELTAALAEIRRCAKSCRCAPTAGRSGTTTTPGTPSRAIFRVTPARGSATGSAPTASSPGWTRSTRSTHGDVASDA